ncbi:hypothetical protein CDAR_579271 [Caerostris darwini]|uniref:Uncharacterized protein n=1 Tax=Caerostris darwini TaxID=1538125 RepID=A0AAV4SN76_9ARAC|nr:hypothetical protein CDAR_579271 [Caerostris darwini]
MRRQRKAGVLLMQISMISMSPGKGKRSNSSPCSPTLTPLSSSSIRLPGLFPLLPAGEVIRWIIIRHQRYQLYEFGEFLGACVGVDEREGGQFNFVGGGIIGEGVQKGSCELDL